MDAHERYEQRLHEEVRTYCDSHREFPENVKVFEQTPWGAIEGLFSIVVQSGSDVFS